MKRIHFLANRDAIINYTLAPVRHNIRQLQQRKYDVEIYYKLTDACLDCDILCLLSKPTYRHVEENKPVFEDDGPVITLLKKARKHASRIIWMDDSDSTSVTHFEILPYIDLYLKKQILKDRSLYRQPFYGGRIFTEFYHQNFKIKDDVPFSQFHALPEEQEHKLRVSWNIGLGDMFSAFALKNYAQRFIPDLVPVNYNVNFVAPQSERPVDIFLRTSANLARKTIAFHRQEMLRRLNDYLDSHQERSGMIGNNVYQGAEGRPLPEGEGRLALKVYRDLMAGTKIVPSPFGWGELGVRDYEAFIFGGMLLKPDMSHMETWPNIFIPEQTYMPIQWDFEDLFDKINSSVHDEKHRLEIARAGQDAYKKSISPEGMTQFCDWFIQQIEGS